MERPEKPRPGPWPGRSSPLLAAACVIVAILNALGAAFALLLATYTHQGQSLFSSELVAFLPLLVASIGLATAVLGIVRASDGRGRSAAVLIVAAILAGLAWFPLAAALIN